MRPSYRTGLVRAGQPLLLWVSGTDPALPAGILAHGLTTGPVQDVGGEEPFVPVLLRATDPPVGRRQVLAHPVLAGLEVLRMPAGSNPSFLDVEQYAALCEAFPQVTAPLEPARARCTSIQPATPPTPGTCATTTRSA